MTPADKMQLETGIIMILLGLGITFLMALILVAIK